MGVFKLDPSTNESVKITLYKNVKNFWQLCDNFQDYPCALIKPELIVNAFQIVAAANKALLSHQFLTKNIYTEILWNLYPGKGIATSLRNFGITREGQGADTNKKRDRHLLVVSLGSVENNIEVQGDEVELDELANLCNYELIKKIYDIKDKEAQTINLLDSILTRIATKDL